jgi:exopolysaccharide biosynthesis polyprenyl glycosylphosphotransferase
VLAALAGAAASVLILGAVGSDGLAFALITALLWPTVAFIVGLYSPDDLRSWASGVPQLPRLVLAVVMVSWPLFGIALVTGVPAPGAVTAVSVLGILTLSGLGHALARTFLHRSDSLRQQTLILGSGIVATNVVEKLHLNRQFGLEPIGIVDDDVHDVGKLDMPRLGGFDDLDDVLTRQPVDRVIIAFSRASHQQLLSCIRSCRDHGVAIDVIPRLFELLDGVRPLGQVGGLPLLSIGSARLVGPSRVAKRLLDILLASGAVVVLSPVLAAIAIAIKLESRGPVFFTQVRAGRGGKVFKLFKFRSMYEDADRRKHEYEQENDNSDGVMFKIRHDPRVTRVGRLLRRLSLDEIPQLFNVIRGQMSLVGPRPLILPESDALDEAWHLRRMELRPGLTGPWQIYGRSETPFQEMVRFDYQYVAGWSLARDLEILLATVPAVLSGRGAY